MKRLPFIRAAAIGVTVASLSLAACAHHPPSPTGFPAAPIADLNAPVPVQSQLPPNANLQDILKAHLADSEGFKLLVSEVESWRAWWKAQAANDPKGDYIVCKPTEAVR